LFVNKNKQLLKTSLQSKRTNLQNFQTAPIIYYCTKNKICKVDLVFIHSIWSKYKFEHFSCFELLY